MITNFDIAVVGGGPAGAAAAAMLARGGLSVVLFEQKLFPRQKVCGEFVSTGARPVLKRLGILQAFDAIAGPPLQRMVAFPAAGHALECALPADGGGNFARALSRDRFDQLILTAARDSGVQIIQPAHVEGIQRAKDHGFSLTLHHASEFHAKVIIVADGKPIGQQPRMAPPIAEVTGAVKDSRPSASSGFLGFKAHFSNCDMPDDVTVIAGAGKIYAGLLRTSDAIEPSGAPAKTYNLAFAAHQSLLEHFRGADDMLNYLLAENRGLWRIMRHGIRRDKWYSCGPMRPGVRRLYHDGCFHAGNSAGEVHALIGEGMTLALRSARLLAEKLITGRADGLSLGAIGQSYEQAWYREFTSRLDAGNLFSNLLMRPILGSLTADALNTFPEILYAAVGFSGKSATRVV